MKRILTITQCFPCGSWLCIEKLLDALASKGYEVTIIGLGEIQKKNPKFKYVVVPYLAFNRFGNITCAHPLVSALWNMPLFLLGSIRIIFGHYDLVAYNGLASGLTLSPLAHLSGSKNIIMYHSYLGHIKNTPMKKMMVLFGKTADLVVANSRGSAKDISQIFALRKVIVNEHFADEAFFRIKTNKAMQKEDSVLKIGYAGRIDEDKLCFPLIEAAKRMFDSGRKDICFYFAGAGSAVNRLIEYARNYPNIKYLGYIKDRAALMDFYKKADVVWSLANETYLCMPAVESLAVGTPVIIPMHSEVRDLNGHRALIEKDLVNKDIGWLVDTNNVAKIIKLLIKIQKDKLFIGKEESCRNYAKKFYSKDNLKETVSRMVLLNKHNGTE